MSGSVLLVVRRCGHLDHLGCAEALVVAALVGERNASYDDGLAWLLARHQEDGTYAVANPRNTADGYRHAVLVGSWALLASLDRFEPRVKGRSR